MQEISKHIVNLLEQDIKAKGNANFIVSGGSSPIKIFEDFRNVCTSKYIRGVPSTPGLCYLLASCSNDF